MKTVIMAVKKLIQQVRRLSSECRDSVNIICKYETRAMRKMQELGGY